MKYLYVLIKEVMHNLNTNPILSACISSFNELSLRVEPFNEDAFVCRILDAGLGGIQLVRYPLYCELCNKDECV
ncbi:unnamed protein product [Schistosoma curassoni]|uniref:Transcriptional regulator n=1 Tax=Schistosoma curassoni TaxID=6186 RepID=A0A183KJL1_9TREM|nr:unnamed protein product [Schistosoma curassoni]